jgi:hypothetical protein
MTVGCTLGVRELAVGTIVEGLGSIAGAHAATSQIATRAERFIEWGTPGLGCR